MKLNRRRILGLGAGCVLASAFGVRASAPKPLVIFAASSLKPVLDEIAALDPSCPLAISYGGSAALARQITLGAPAEIFLSANPQWSEVVTPTDLGEEPVRVSLLSNRLVVIAARGSPSVELAKLPSDAKIAMGLVNAVPVGQYGKAALQALEHWERLSGNIVETQSASAALTMVARGEMPYGVVYKTDALAEARVDIVAEFPSASHPPIIYQMVLTAKPPPRESAVKLFSWLQGDEAKAIYAKHGFIVL